MRHRCVADRSIVSCRYGDRFSMIARSVLVRALKWPSCRSARSPTLGAGWKSTHVVVSNRVRAYASHYILQSPTCLAPRTPRQSASVRCAFSRGSLSPFLEGASSPCAAEVLPPSPPVCHSRRPRQLSLPPPAATDGESCRSHGPVLTRRLLAICFYRSCRTARLAMRCQGEAGNALPSWH